MEHLLVQYILPRAIETCVAQNESSGIYILLLTFTKLIPDYLEPTRFAKARQSRGALARCVLALMCDLDVCEFPVFVDDDDVFSWNLDALPFKPLSDMRYLHYRVRLLNAVRAFAPHDLIDQNIGFNIAMKTHQLLTGMRRSFQGRITQIIDTLPFTGLERFNYVLHIQDPELDMRRVRAHVLQLPIHIKHVSLKITADPGINDGYMELHSQLFQWLPAQLQTLEFLIYYTYINVSILIAHLPTTCVHLYFPQSRIVIDSDLPLPLPALKTFKCRSFDMKSSCTLHPQFFPRTLEVLEGGLPVGAMRQLSNVRTLDIVTEHDTLVGPMPAFTHITVNFLCWNEFMTRAFECAWLPKLRSIRLKLTSIQYIDSISLPTTPFPDTVTDLELILAIQYIPAYKSLLPPKLHTFHVHCTSRAHKNYVEYLLEQQHPSVRHLELTFTPCPMPRIARPLYISPHLYSLTLNIWGWNNKRHALNFFWKSLPATLSYLYITHLNLYGSEYVHLPRSLTHLKARTMKVYELEDRFLADLPRELRHWDVTASGDSTRFTWTALAYLPRQLEYLNFTCMFALVKYVDAIVLDGTMCEMAIEYPYKHLLPRLLRIRFGHLHCWS